MEGGGSIWAASSGGTSRSLSRAQRVAHKPPAGVGGEGGFEKTIQPVNETGEEVQKDGPRRRKMMIVVLSPLLAILWLNRRDFAAGPVNGSNLIFSPVLIRRIGARNEIN